MTPLDIAIESDSMWFVELLIAAGVDLDRQEKCGKTTLHYVVKNSNLDVAVLLLKAGANPNIEDKTGMTSLELSQLLMPEFEEYYYKHDYKNPIR